MMNLVSLIVALLSATNPATSQQLTSRTPEVSLVQDGGGQAAHHGWEKIKAALSAKGISFEEASDPDAAHGQILIYAGPATGRVAQVLESQGVRVPEKPESLVIHKAVLKGKQALLLAGRDDRGLMYALLEAADRIGWSTDKNQPLSEIRNTVESPDVSDRDVIIFTMQKHQYEDRLHNEDYWAKYFDMMADARLNTFHLLFAYEANGYNCPVYPYYMDVKGFPQVRVVGLSKAEQQQNLADLHRLVRMAHERGISVTFGIWCHYYRDTTWGAWEPVDHSKPPAPFTVTGLTEENLIPYTMTALKQFLTEFHEIDNVQLLMMDESGLKTEQMKEFWKNIFPALKEAAPNLQYEIRAKGVSDDLIKQGIDLGLKIRVNTKVWAEQVGLPFFPTHVQDLDQFNRRGGYADMLKYPREYKLHWTLWTAGTNRILLWGDPDYVRRFAAITHLGDAQGFDIDEPLATKMAGHPHDMKPFQLLSPKYQYYDYEFQRYWYFFQLYGRLTYDPNTPNDEWDHEFASHYGKGAAPYIRGGLQRASQILPEITAYNLPEEAYPTTRGWPERQRRDDLPEYVKSTPSDTEQFESLQDAADDVVNGRFSAKMTPIEVSRWFARAAHDVRDLVAKAEANAGPHPNKEFISTVVDLKILSDLADYHSHRVLAGLNYALFEKTRDLNALDDAIDQEQKATDAWAGIVRDAGDVYSFDLMMGVPKFDLSGHWRDELVKLKAGLEALKKQRSAYQIQVRRVIGKYDLESGPAKPGYQHIKESGIANETVRNGSILISFKVPDGRYEVSTTIHDDKTTHGPMWIDVNGVEYSDAFPVPVGETVQKSIETSAVNGAIKVLFDHATSVEPYASSIVLTRIDPVIAHVPIQRLSPGRDLEIRATVEGISPIASVRAYYGDSHRGFAVAEMSGSGSVYKATIPASRLSVGTQYYIEATDSTGRISTYPDEGSSEPLSVLITGDNEPPILHAKPISTAEPNHPLLITAQVSDPSGVKWVHLCYRGVSEFQDYQVVDMLPTGRGNEYQATVPGIDVDSHFDFMYFFEVMDNAGNGRIYPDMDNETPYIIVKLKRVSQP